MNRATAVSKSGPGPAILVSVRLLIVDDHRSFRRAARRLLGERGFEVVGEADGCRSALDAATRLAPDGVLLDVRLGADDGYCLCRKLTAALPDVVVLMTSVSADAHVPERVREVGARAFVSKPDLAVADLEAFFTRIG
jgi:DNA-binding NarL/FixJ family response regulator